MLKKVLKRLLGAKPEAPVTPTFDRYISGMPSLQNAIDAVPGWSTMFPPEYGLKAGGIPTFADNRIVWALEQFGDVTGKAVLELGPLEGSHTYMLDAAGASVDAIEANQLAFLRCLIAKEVWRTTNARFLLGDFVEWLRKTDKRYDLIVACGVLYHMKDPLEVLELIAKRSDAVYFWTHLTWNEAMPLEDPRRVVFLPTPEIHQFHGVPVRLWRRSYFYANKDPAFCGGMEDEHRWIEREDFVAALKALGYTDIRFAHDEPNHRFGPALSVFARK